MGRARHVDLVDPGRGELDEVEPLGVAVELDEQLGLRTRDENARPNGQLDGAKRGGSGDVLQRFAGRAAHDGGPKLFLGVGAHLDGS